MHHQVSGKKQQYTRLVRRILMEVRQQQPPPPPETARREIDLTVATYALFGMMNWIYNWYDPDGPLSVGDLVDNITRLFLSGFLTDAGELHFKPKSARMERLSVWRAPEA
jgi:hypothetical protein